MKRFVALSIASWKRSDPMARRPIAFAGVVAMGLLVLVAFTGPVEAKAPGPNGQIAFTRQDPTCGKACESSIYTVNPDGSHEQKLVTGVCCPVWSPDGTQVSFLSECSFGGPCEATMVDVGTGIVRTLPNPNPALYNEFFSCNGWSPDGTRLACDVVSDTPGVTGLYTIRSSDGGDLTKVMSCADECGATDWSPDGKRFLVGTSDPDGLPALFVVRLNGTGLKQITPAGMDVDLNDGAASWSPTGNRIVFGGRADPDHRRTIFTVNADGTGFHQVALSGCGGAFAAPAAMACFDPDWSPDGAKLVFVRASGNRGFPSELNSLAIFTANADGTGLSQVTTATNLGLEGGPDWGTHPTTT